MHRDGRNPKVRVTERLGVPWSTGMRKGWWSRRSGFARRSALCAVTCGVAWCVPAASATMCFPRLGISRGGVVRAGACFPAVGHLICFPAAINGVVIAGAEHLSRDWFRCTHSGSSSGAARFSQLCLSAALAFRGVTSVRLGRVCRVCARRSGADLGTTVQIALVP